VHFSDFPRKTVISFMFLLVAPSHTRSNTFLHTLTHTQPAPPERVQHQAGPQGVCLCVCVCVCVCVKSRKCTYFDELAERNRCTSLKCTYFAELAERNRCTSLVQAFTFVPSRVWWRTSCWWVQSASRSPASSLCDRSSTHACRYVCVCVCVC
jgi:hypothetical protein